jgi:hypothetical protein
MSGKTTKGETILSGGRQVPTEQFANTAAFWFFVFSVIALFMAVIHFWIQKRRRG